jgi:TonB family protein
MKGFIRNVAGILALAAVTGCATQPVRPTPIPPYLAMAFAKADLHTVGSISYQDEHGRAIGADDFAAQYHQKYRSFAMTKVLRNGLPDVTLRLHARSVEDSAQGLQRIAAVVDFRTCPKPSYPIDALRAHHTGKVTLNFLVSIDGYVKKAEITHSSGFPGLDQAAMVALVRCRFKPATSGGVPLETWSPVQYVWSMS